MKNYTTRLSFIVQFLFYTGCRISEATGLKISDCTPNDNFVSMRILGKGRKERILTIPTILYNKIQAFYDGNTYLFETRNKKR